MAYSFTPGQNIIIKQSSGYHLVSVYAKPDEDGESCFTVKNGTRAVILADNRHWSMLRIEEFGFGSIWYVRSRNVTPSVGMSSLPHGKTCVAKQPEGLSQVALFAENEHKAIPARWVTNGTQMDILDTQDDQTAPVVWMSVRIAGDDWAEVYYVKKHNVVVEAVPAAAAAAEEAPAAAAAAEVAPAAAAAEVAPAAAAAEEGGLDANAECTICLAMPSVLAAIPCGHRFCCVGCKSLGETIKTCPFCRCDISMMCRIW